MPARDEASSAGVAVKRDESEGWNPSGPARGDLFIHEHAREGSEPYKHHCEYSEADEPRAELSHGFDSAR
jgi:hypothetical protein